VASEARKEPSTEEVTTRGAVYGAMASSRGSPSQ